MSPQPHRGRTGPGSASGAGKPSRAVDRSGRSKSTRGQGPGKSAAKGAKAAKVPAKDVHDPDGIRLQKLLAQAGLGSRRACAELIPQGRVIVDDRVVRELGVRVDPARAVIHVDGLRVQLDEDKV